tara:strand:+ start:237 stop:428 length:192 start_codon:yes stop_codon:yes gene_type:complete
MKPNPEQPKEITLVMRHTEMYSDDYISISLKSENDSIDELIEKTKNAFPTFKKTEKKPTNSVI